MILFNSIYWAVLYGVVQVSTLLPNMSCVGLFDFQTRNIEIGTKFTTEVRDMNWY